VKIHTFHVLNVANEKCVALKRLWQAHEFEKLELFGWGFPAGDLGQRGKQVHSMADPIILRV
jgi:hypothetical protein